MTTAENYFDKPYIKGDIQLRKYCSVGHLKMGETNKHPIFRECSINIPCPCSVTPMGNVSKYVQNLGMGVDKN